MKTSTKRSQGEEFMLRNELAVIIGIIAATAVCMGSHLVLWYILNTYGSRPETGPFLLMLLTIGLGPLARSFCGGWVAARLGSSRPMLLAMIVGMISLVGGAVMQVDIMAFEYIGYGGTLSFLAILSILLHLGAAWLAGFIEQKRRAALHTPSPAFAKNAKAE
jgi:hypothetical protein